MKRFFYLAAAALVALWACEEKEGPDSSDSITIISEAVVKLEAESSISTVVFKTNAAWTASVDEDFLVPDITKGDAADEVKIKVTAQNLPEGEFGRYGNLIIKAGTAEAKVLFYQGMVFIVSDDVEVGIEGGTAEFTVVTNLDYSFKKYDGEDQDFHWAPVTFDQATGKGSFAVEKNEGYDTRAAYVKFTVPAIQVPVYDEETGEETGETQDAVYRIYVYQEGNSKEEWRTYLTEAFNVGEGATHTLAFFNGKLLVSDAKKVHIVNPDTGVFEDELATGNLPIQSIANDDEGNLLFANLGVYGDLFDVYAVKAGATDLSNPVHLIHFVNEAWSGSTGIDKVAAKGNVFGNGIVTAMYGGVISYGGLSYTLYWTIANGKAEEAYYNEWNPVVNPSTSGWLATPTLEDDLWLSNRAAFVPAGASASDGFFYGGYDKLYNVYYYNGEDWQVSVEGAGDWAGGPQGLKVTTWDGKKILVIAQMGYVWWSEGWGMPAYLWVVDVTNPVEPSVLSCAAYDSPGQLISGDTEDSTVDVLPAVDGNDLVVYYLDASHGQLIKVRFPKL